MSTNSDNHTVKPEAMNLVSAHPPPPMFHQLQGMPTVPAQSNFNMRAPANVNLIPTSITGSQSMPSNTLMGNQYQTYTQQFVSQGQAVHQHPNMISNLPVMTLQQQIPQQMHLIQNVPQQQQSSNTTTVTVQQAQMVQQQQQGIPVQQGQGGQLVTGKEDTIMEIEATIEELLEKAAIQAKIPTAQALAVLPRLKDEGVYTSEILVSLDPEDGKRLLGLGLWKSLEIVSKTEKAKRHKSKNEERRKSTSADLQQHLNTYALSRGHAMFSLQARSTKEVYCMICNKSIQLNKEGSISNVKRHVEGREEDVYTRHQRNFDAANSISPPANTGKTTPKKRKNQSPEDKSKRKKSDDDKKDVEQTMASGTATSISDMMTSTTPNITPTQ